MTLLAIFAPKAVASRSVHLPSVDGRGAGAFVIASGQTFPRCLHSHVQVYLSSNSNYFPVCRLPPVCNHLLLPSGQSWPRIPSTRVSNQRITHTITDTQPIRIPYKRPASTHPRLNIQPHTPNSRPSRGIRHTRERRRGDPDRAIRTKRSSIDPMPPASPLEFSLLLVSSCPKLKPELSPPSCIMTIIVFTSSSSPHPSYIGSLVTLFNL